MLGTDKCHECGKGFHKEHHSMRADNTCSGCFRTKTDLRLYKYIHREENRYDDVCYR